MSDTAQTLFIIFEHDEGLDNGDENRHRARCYSDDVIVEIRDASSVGLVRKLAARGICLTGSHIGPTTGNGWTSQYVVWFDRHK